jgi:hypothetical protein
MKWFDTLVENFIEILCLQKLDFHESAVILALEILVVNSNIDKIIPTQIDFGSAQGVCGC